MKAVHIQLIDLQVYERLTPLAAGLMAAAVLDDPHRAARCRIALRTWSVSAKAETIVASILAEPCDLVGFSTYVWNARLVRRVVSLLARARPSLPVLLGGPQVVRGAEAWRGVAPNLLVADGEGEPIFVELAGRLLGGGELPEAAGVSGFWEGAAIGPTSPAAAADLSQIPSPFLMGLFPSGQYTQAILETNRGCPFECSFCFWGLGSKRVRRFSDARIREELDWIFRENMLSVFVADANFGMYPRDEEIATALADNRRRRGTPLMVSFNSMKNRPERMVRIAQIVGNAGLATTQSMAIQSMDEATLRTSGRESVRTSAYTAALQQLNAGGLTTYVELIWPLPGETLASFAEGIDALCAMGAQSFVVYPLLALPNTHISERRESFGLTLTASRDEDAGEYVYVTGTREVSAAEYQEGLWLILSLNLLHNTRALAGTFGLLKRRGIRHVEVLAAFARWAKESADLPLFERHARASRGVEHAAWAYWGSVAFEALHAERERFVSVVEAFCSAQPWWDDEARAYVEVDRLFLPYLFSNTPLTAWDGAEVRVQARARFLQARLSPRAREIVREHQGRAVPARIELNPWMGQLPRFDNQSETAAYDYAYGQLQRIARLAPRLVGGPKEP
ncbi:MAG: cobalamin-dependent protein [Acidobacteriota bacterium]|nr:cobalamin-dependent protein [Acidobacteriota bacterium]